MCFNATQQMMRSGSKPITALDQESLVAMSSYYYSESLNAPIGSPYHVDCIAQHKAINAELSKRFPNT